jgi:hypothetical protein
MRENTRLGIDVDKNPLFLGAQGVCFTNIFAQNPNPFMNLYTKFERTVYDHLE